MINSTKLTIIENGKPKVITIKPYEITVKTSYSNNVKATRMPIPYTKVHKINGGYDILRTFSTDKGIVIVKNDEKEVYHESEYTLEQYNNLRND